MSAPIAKRLAVSLFVVLVIALSLVVGLRTAGVSPTTPASPLVVCAPTHRDYPGALSSDCVARAEHEVALDRTVVSATWALQNDSFGLRSICAAVSIRNYNRWSYFFNDFNMTLRPPMGKVMVLNFSASDPLGDGFIMNGGVATGNICFDYSGAPGTYVGIYQPNPRKTTLRGIWLFHIA